MKGSVFVFSGQSSELQQGELHECVHRKASRGR